MAVGGQRSVCGMNVLISHTLLWLIAEVVVGWVER